ncbi:glycosyltransferase family 4 protein [Salipiger bermudensis]|uniref:glycosyltransferase family 4 protein n=1 Tax=Salipiger bermudensis TaxID=344736 RepID=UPI001A8CE537|nr:glycosyltransferase family 4 protein [Salipiger bermudensis]MBN9678431.1 glycosyltransferase [Salipiger bermudensis]
MKLAALVDFPYWEAKVGTAIRYESLCQSLAKVCDLTVISTVTMPDRYEGFREDAPYELIDRSMLKEIHLELGAGEIPGVRPDRQISVRTVKHLVESGGFDAVLTPYFNRNWMIDHLSPDIVRIIDTHDCQSQRTRSFARHGMTPTFNMSPEQEGAELDRYDIVLAMSDEDHAEFAPITARPVVTTPFRLPVRDLAPLREIYGPRGQNRELLFIAAKSDVNDLTLDYLLREVLPLVPGRLTLNIVGNVTVPDITPFNTTVVRHENVEDIVPIYARVALALNPTYAGGGVKTKTLEAICYGVPILTTDEGARGMRHLIPDALVANDKELFAYRIGQLLEAPEMRDALARELIANLRAENSEAWLPAFAQILRAVRSRKLGEDAA